MSKPQFYTLDSSESSMLDYLRVYIWGRVHTVREVHQVPLVVPRELSHIMIKRGTGLVTEVSNSLEGAPHDE